MLFKLLIVSSYVILPVKTKECQAGQNCEFRCCVTPGNQNVLCRQNCYGLSCELDGHCDGDCCVNFTCSSCLLKRLISTQTNVNIVGTSSLHPSQKSSPSSVEKTDASRTASELKKEDDFTRTEFFPPTKHVCSRFTNGCPTRCCIDGQCVDSFRCEPVFAARGGRGSSGGRRGRSRRGSFHGGGGGGGYSENSSGKGFPLVWGIVLIIVVFNLLYMLW